MQNETLTLTFSVEGSFITRTAREWFFCEGKPYEVVEELLLSCMCGTDTPTHKLKIMAQNILLGIAEFRGNSGDGTFCYAEVENPATVNILTKYSNLLKEKNQLKDDYEKLNKRFLNLVDAISQCSFGDSEEALEIIEDNEDKRIFTDMLRNFGECREEIYSTGERKVNFITGNTLLDDFIEANKTTDNYGWLSPSGEFFPVPWCNHQEWADKKIRELGLRDEYKKWSDTTKHSCGMWGDFLCEKGWILLHNPSQGTARVSRNEEKRITKAQSEFLFGYYTDRGKHDLAKQYLI